MYLDFFAGCVGGCAGVIVGHPLDTIKVHIQTQTPSRTSHYWNQLLTREGSKALFKGLTSPLAGVAGLNAIVFGIYGHTQRKFADPDSLKAHFLAGSCAGFFQSFLAAPIELAKLRAQISNSNQTPLACIKMIYRRRGITGVFQGLNMTICRDVPSFAAYFLTYELLLRRGHGNSGDASTKSMLVAGGIAGVISWTITYPADVIKTRMQCDGAHRRLLYGNAWQCIKLSLATEGYRCFFKGLLPTVIRAFPVNAAVFTVFTWTIRLLDSMDSTAGIQWDICVMEAA